jgi:hypothetical protein
MMSGAWPESKAKRLAVGLALAVLGASYCPWSARVLRVVSRP